MSEDYNPEAHKDFYQNNIFYHQIYFKLSVFVSPVKFHVFYF